MDKSIEEKIIRYYCDLKLSYRQTSAKLGVSPDTVKLIIQTKGLARTQAEGCKIRSSPEYSDKIRQTQLGEINSRAKLTTKEVLEIRERYEILQKSYNKYQSQKILADEYGVKRPTISDIVLLRRWKHI